MTFQFNNLEDSDHLEFDQLRTDHNISKILSGNVKYGMSASSIKITNRKVFKSGRCK